MTSTPAPQPDVLVIGGGLIGCSIAWRLAQQRLSVTLIEARSLGQEASFAGAGMLVPGSEYDTPSSAFTFALRSLQLYPAFVAELTHATAAPIEFSLCGSLELAASPAELDALHHRAALQATFGVHTQSVPAADLSRLIPGLRSGLAGAVFYPHEGQVDPRTLLPALRLALTQLHVSILENTPVTHLALHADSVTATLASGQRLTAANAVLAAGAWASSLGLPDIPKAFPVRGHLLGFPLPPRSLPHVLRSHHTYIVQRSTGYTIAGATTEDAGFDRALDPAAIHDLSTRAAALYSPLHTTPRDAWNGFRPATSAPDPQIGRWQNSPLFTAYGHFRNGILLAPATAETIASEITRSRS